MFLALGVLPWKSPTGSWAIFRSPYSCTWLMFVSFFTSSAQWEHRYKKLSKRNTSRTPPPRLWFESKWIEPSFPKSRWLNITSKMSWWIQPPVNTQLIKSTHYHPAYSITISRWKEQWNSITKTTKTLQQMIIMAIEQSSTSPIKPPTPTN